MRNIGKKTAVVVLTGGLTLSLGLVGTGTAQAATYGCPPGLHLVPGSFERTQTWDGDIKVTYKCSNEDGSITAVGTFYE